MSARRAPHRQTGFVLLNALLLMAALSAAAVALLQLSQDSRTRIGLARAADQLRLALDGAEPLALALLRRDRDALVDSLGQPWADGPRRFQIGEIPVTAQIVDLQARFNVNWLSRPEDLSSQIALGRLLSQADAPRSVIGATVAFLSPGSGPPATQGPVPIRPDGRLFAFLDEWRQVAGVTPEIQAAMAPSLAALPDDSLINVNTVDPRIFAALFAPGRDGQIAALFARRAREPFADIDSFLGRAAFHLGEDVAEDIDGARLTVASVWFAVTLSANLGAASERRRLILRRSPDGATLIVAHRLADRG